MRISLIGAGNVAWHLGHAFSSGGVRIQRVMNRGKEAGQALARELKTDFVADLTFQVDDSEVLILAISDSAISDVLHMIRSRGAVLVHTAGSIPMDVLKEINVHCGVLYPFQTLTRGIVTDLRKVPFCIEASDKESLETLQYLATTVSDFVRVVNSEQRSYLHLAGIILNNFTNHLITLASDYLEKKHIDRELILPLIRETFRKLENISPAEAQTGPARRNNRIILEKHRQMLEKEPVLKNLYSLISDSIIAYYKMDH